MEVCLQTSATISVYTYVSDLKPFACIAPLDLDNQAKFNLR